jgi:DNA-binding NarL/FixJ family response regulator
MVRVERDAEAAVLEASLADCVGGTGGAVVVSGPIGVGKTELLRATAEAATERGFAYLAAIGSQAERMLPMAVLGQIFARAALPDDLAQRARRLLDAGALTASLHDREDESVQQMVTPVMHGLAGILLKLAEQEPLLIAVDDAHLADVASLQCLRYLIRRIDRARVLVVLTDTTTVRPMRPLFWAELLSHPHCQLIRLNLLSPVGVAAVLRDASVDAADDNTPALLYQMSGGNPLLLHALLDDIRAASRNPRRGGPSDTTLPVPGRAYASAVMMSLYRSDPVLLPVVRALAVLDERVTPAHLAELLDSTAAATAWGIKAATAAGLIDDGQLRHWQSRAAVLDNMGPSERAALHARVAEMLYHRGASPMRVARHQLAAQREPAAWMTAVLLKAAEQALEQDDTAFALDCLRHAERGGAEGFDVEWMLLRAKWRLDPGVAETHLHNLREAARVGHLPGKDALNLVAALQWYGRPAEAEEMLDHVRRSARADAAELAAPLYSARMDLAYRYPGVADRVLEPHSGLPLQSGNSVKLQVQAAGIIESVFADGFTDPVVAEATALLQQSRLEDETFGAIWTALDTLIFAECLDTAASWCDSLLHEAQRRAVPAWLAILSGLRAMVSYRQGELLSAERYAGDALGHVPPKGLGVFIGIPLSVLILTTTRVGEDETALSHLTMAVPEAMFQTTVGLHYLHARGRCYLKRRNYKAAIADFEACGELMRRWNLDLPGLVPWRTDLAEARLALGDPACDLVTDQIGRLGRHNDRTRGISLRVLASASELRQRAPLLRESVELLQLSGAQVELADTLAELSRTQHALGEYTDARVTGRRAQELASQCMMRPKSTHRPPDAVVPPIATLADDPAIFELSDAERRVASLAAQGCTNRQIARKLFVTVSTVEQHLTRVYRKLQINSRSDLPASLLSRIAKAG